MYEFEQTLWQIHTIFSNCCKKCPDFDYFFQKSVSALIIFYKFALNIFKIVKTSVLTFSTEY